MGQDVNSPQEDNFENFVSEIEAISNQLCLVVKGDFNFTIETKNTQERSLQKLVMLLNFVIDTARRALLEVNEQNLKLTELDRLKSEFMANISHELRTPLTLILGPLENLLEHDSFETTQLTNLKRIHRNAMRLYMLVNDLLDLSKIEAGKFTVNEELIDINELISEIVEDSYGLARERKIELTFVPCDQLELVLLDRKMMEKITLNLLSNALKFTPAEGSVIVEINKIENVLYLSVKDSGIGIPSEEISRLFERFHQLDSSSTRSHEGTGIGLSLINQFVTLMKGKIAVQSEVGKGSIFTVELPIQHLENQIQGDCQKEKVGGSDYIIKASLSKLALESPKSPQDLSTKESLQRENRDLPSIVIADDNPDMRSYITSLLKEFYQVYSAQNGEEALKAIYDHDPQVILSDIMMPVMDGLELTQRVKSDPTIQHIPIILITAKAGKEAIVSGLTMGADDYLSKPFSPKELQARVESSIRLYQNYKEILDLNDQLKNEIEERKILETKNQVLNAELIVAARRAGMADISTSVLHNVGNVLNTINTSTMLVGDKIKNSKISNLIELANLVKEHEIDFPSFVSNTPQGQRLAGYIIKLSDIWSNDKVSIIDEMKSVENGVQHVKEIIGKQNLLSGMIGITETLDIHGVIEDAILLNKDQYIKSEINIVRDFENIGNVKIDRIKLLQIIVNLLKNGIESINEQNPDYKKIVLKTQQKDQHHFMIQVSDNGIGVLKENIPKIFSFGFTTKKNGHGFGLHSSAISATEMGAQFQVESGGAGKGATFSLIIPYETSDKKDKKND